MVSEPFDVLEHHYPPLPLRKLQEALLQGQSVVERSHPAVAGAFGDVADPHRGPPPPEIVEAEAVEDDEEPGQEGAPGLEARQRVESANERLLGQIPGLLTVSDPASGVGLGPLPVTADERLVSAAASVPAAPDPPLFLLVAAGAGIDGQNGLCGQRAAAALSYFLLR